MYSLVLGVVGSPPDLMVIHLLVLPSTLKTHVKTGVKIHQLF